MPANIPSLTAIVAMARNRAIGYENKMPWHLPEDLAFFRAQTLGRVVILGRKTLESIGKPLPRRVNVVLGSVRSGSYPGVISAHSVEDALIKAGMFAQLLNSDDIMVIGGASIYEQFISYCNKFIITEIDLICNGDAFFPELEAGIKVTGEEQFSSKTGLNYCIRKFEREKIVNLNNIKSESKNFLEDIGAYKEIEFNRRHG